MERHVGSYLSAFFRLLGESVCVSLAGGGREWETVECVAVRASLFACAFQLLVLYCRRRPGPGLPVD